eukprot:6461487-Amphidinium_carterae.4
MSYRHWTCRRTWWHTVWSREDKQQQQQQSSAVKLQVHAFKHASILAATPTVEPLELRAITLH